MQVLLVEVWLAKVPPSPEREWDGKRIPARPERLATFAQARDSSGISVNLDLDDSYAPGQVKAGAVLDIQCNDWPEAAIRAKCTGRPVPDAAAVAFAKVVK